MKGTKKNIWQIKATDGASFKNSKVDGEGKGLNRACELTNRSFNPCICKGTLLKPWWERIQVSNARKECCLLKLKRSSLSKRRSGLKVKSLEP